MNTFFKISERESHGTARVAAEQKQPRLRFRPTAYYVHHFCEPGRAPNHPGAIDAEEDDVRSSSTHVITLSSLGLSYGSTR